MKTVFVLLTERFADWEASFVTPELNQPGTGYQVKTIAIDKEPKVSMGGLTVLPDYELADFYNQPDAAMLILVGGQQWGEDKHLPVKELVAHCFAREIPVAAICDATTFLGRHGFLEDRKHTGNTLGLLKQGAPDYRGEALYVEAQSVRDGNLITANGSAPAEFARDILAHLGVMEGEKLEGWYKISKHGFLPN